MTIRFDERVAIVTGAGGGLGRAYAIALAARGARVVVNDLGALRDGSGGSDAARAVVDEITRAGGEAIADAGDVSDFAQMQRMAAAARERWGRIDILINNAGILRDQSFAKMVSGDFEAVVRVHLQGSANATKAVWADMRTANYGRVLMTASSTGLFGNFGQTNYGAAKLGLVGFARSLGLEGAKHDIRVNTIAPVAGTRMTEGLMPEAAFRAFAPEEVVPAALFLVSEDPPAGAIVGAGAGVVQASYITLTPGVLLPPDDRTPEAVAAHWPAITDRAGEIVPRSGAEQSLTILKRAGLL